MYWESTNLMVRLVLNTGDTIDLDRMVEGVPIRAFLEWQPKSPVNYIRTREIGRMIADEAAQDAARRRAREMERARTIITEARSKLTAEEQQAVALLVERQGIGALRQILQSQSAR